MSIYIKKTSHSGFSLIELMIVVVIAGILASIAIASYSDSVMKSRRTDAKDMLLSTSTKLEKCKALYGVYTTNCSISNGATIPSSEGLYTITVVSTANTFTLTARPVTGTSQAGDSDCSTITLTNLGIQGGTTANCW